MNTSTIITGEELRVRLMAEGINPDAVSVMIPRWAETAPKAESVLSALLTCDLIARSDGSIVALDGNLGFDSALMGDLHRGLATSDHARNHIFETFPELDGIDVPTADLTKMAREHVGWETYISRLSTIPDGGVLVSQ